MFFLWTSISVNGVTGDIAALSCEFFRSSVSVNGVAAYITALSCEFL